MPAPDLNTYGVDPVALFPGQVATQEFSQTGTLINSGSNPIDFGVAVARDTTDATGRSCKKIAADGDLIEGITTMSSLLNPASTDGLNTVNYPEGESVGILYDGQIGAVAVEAVQGGDEVISITAQGGALGGTHSGAVGSGRVLVPGARWMQDVASGGIGRIRIKSVGAVRTS